MFCCKKTGWQNLKKSPSPLWTGLYPCLLRNLFFVECQLTASCGCITTSWSFWWSALLNAPADAGWPTRCLVSQTKQFGKYIMEHERWWLEGEGRRRIATNAALCSHLRTSRMWWSLSDANAAASSFRSRSCAGLIRAMKTHRQHDDNGKKGGRGKRRSGPAGKAVKTCQT